MATLEVVDVGVQLSINGEDSNISTIETPIILEIAAVGARGATGGNLWLVAGQDISGHSAVSVGADGKAYLAHCNAYQPIAGIAINAASIGANIEIQSSGVMTMNGWSFDIAKPVFVLENGQLSTTPSIGALYSTAVGVSNYLTSLVVAIQPQIKL